MIEVSIGDQIKLKTKQRIGNYIGPHATLIKQHFLAQGKQNLILAFLYGPHRYKHG